jgi:hypothetical protein
MNNLILNLLFLQAEFIAWRRRVFLAFDMLPSSPFNYDISVLVQAFVLPLKKGLPLKLSAKLCRVKGSYLIQLPVFMIARLED